MLREGELLAGDFEILRRLGGGGMGAVYLAHQRSTDAFRAVKVMLPQWTEHQGLVRRFEQEARACGKIQSDHVVKILAYGVEPERKMPWLVMDYLPGETLDQRVVRLGVAPISELRELLVQLFHGVGAAHDAGVVHRDLKPQNIYVAESHRAGVPFTVKVLDFGIAKLLGGSQACTGAMGTRAWMAPEQERSNIIITPAADVWALGLITFWLLTGKQFWLHADGNQSDLSFEMYFERIPLASQRATELGVARLLPGFDNWFSRCVEREPQRRFPTAGACWHELKALFDATDDGLSAGHVTAPVSEQAFGAVSHAQPLGHPQPLGLPQPPSFRTTAPSVRQNEPEVLLKAKSPKRWPLIGGTGAVVGLLAAGSATFAFSDVADITAYWTDPLPAATMSTLGATRVNHAPSTISPSPSETRPSSPTPPSGMVFVPAGEFERGMDDGKKRHLPHRVTLSKGFFIDQLETSVKEYRECVDVRKCTPNSLHGRPMDAATRARLEPVCNLHSDNERLAHPINCVDRAQAESYCAFRGKRLPTEAEWEYAARGNDGRAFPWGTEPSRSCEMTVLTGMCGQPPGTRPVGSRSADSESPFGVLDMSGNVWEWVSDAWNEGSYSRGDVTDPFVQSPSNRGILRGGSWDFAPERGHVAYRLPFDRREGNVGAGFRCAKDARR